MSKTDYLEFGKSTHFFVYRKVRIITATNSLKLQCASRKGRENPYIWIDPSWALYKNHKFICSSWSHPWHTEVGYLFKFKQWCKKFNIIQDEKILSTSFCTVKNATIFQFTNGFVLFSFSSKEDEDGFDNWYVRSPNPSFKRHA